MKNKTTSIAQELGCTNSSLEAIVEWTIIPGGTECNSSFLLYIQVVGESKTMATSHRKYLVLHIAEVLLRQPNRYHLALKTSQTDHLLVTTASDQHSTENFLHTVIIMFQVNCKAL